LYTPLEVLKSKCNFFLAKCKSEKANVWYILLLFGKSANENTVSDTQLNDVCVPTVERDFDIISKNSWIILLICTK
jgi:hypothetical protein